MPSGDDVLDVPVVVEGDTEMASDLSDNVANHMLTSLIQTGDVAQNNFVTMQKISELDYLENKRMVTLDEAIGAREVQSKVTPGGPAPAGT